VALAAGGAPIQALADIGPNTALDGDGVVFANVSISVAEIGRSTRFYQALGFEAGELHPLPGEVARLLGAKGKDPKLAIRFLKRDGVALELVQLTPTPPGRASGGAAAELGLAHIALRVDDVARVAAAVRANGGTVLEKSLTRMGQGPQGVEIVFATDPDGTRIEIAGPIKG
jgi:catechol 2,3-dioxygenase-like lactoylglutathione lyase family enzyme